MSCFCQECGKKYKVDVIVSNKLWDNIRPADKVGEGGLLCGPCIARRVEDLTDKYEAYNLKRINKES